MIKISISIALTFNQNKIFMFDHLEKETIPASYQETTKSVHGLESNRAAKVDFKSTRASSCWNFKISWQKMAGSVTTGKMREARKIVF